MSKIKTKSEFLALLKARLPAGSTMMMAEEMLKQFSGAVTDGIAAGATEIQVPWFGTITVADVAARKGKNPMTGETIDIPAKRRIKMKPAAVLKNAIAGVA